MNPTNLGVGILLVLVLASELRSFSRRSSVRRFDQAAKTEKSVKSQVLRP